MRISLLFFGLLCALPLHAKPIPVGYVETVKGDAWIIFSGADTVSAKAGVAMFPGSVLKTGPARSLGVTSRCQPRCCSAARLAKASISSAQANARQRWTR